jgi:hypothetical protein
MLAFSRQEYALEVKELKGRKFDLPILTVQY